MPRVKFDKSDWFWSQSIVFTEPFKTGISLDLDRGPDFQRMTKGTSGDEVTCDQASLYFRGGKVRLIQLLDYLSVASPESGLFSDWSRNKRYLELSR